MNDYFSRGSSFLTNKIIEARLSQFFNSFGGILNVTAVTDGNNLLNWGRCVRDTLRAILPPQSSLFLGDRYYFFRVIASPGTA